MLNHIRLMFIALFMGLFLVACGDDSAQQDTAEETATQSEMSSEETVGTEDSAAAEETAAVEEMTEEEAIAKWGEPDLTQTRTIDQLVIVHHEWHGEDGITAVQFENGVATYTQFIPAE